MGARDDRALLAARAKLHKLEGTKVSRDEQRALAAEEKREREELLDELLHACPKGVYLELAGRQQKVIDEQARQYSLPLLGRELDLFAAVKALHDLIANNAANISTEGGPTLGAQRIGEQVKTQRLKRRLLSLEIELRRDAYIPRAELAKRLDWWGSQLREFGRRLGRKFGKNATHMWNDFLIGLALDVERGE